MLCRCLSRSELWRPFLMALNSRLRMSPKLQASTPLDTQLKIYPNVLPPSAPTQSVSKFVSCRIVVDRAFAVARLASAGNQLSTGIFFADAGLTTERARL